LGSGDTKGLSRPSYGLSPALRFKDRCFPQISFSPQGVHVYWVSGDAVASFTPADGPNPGPWLRTISRFFPAIIATGQAFIDAKKALPHGQFERLFAKHVDSLPAVLRHTSRFHASAIVSASTGRGPTRCYPWQFSSLSWWRSSTFSGDDARLPGPSPFWVRERKPCRFLLREHRRSSREGWRSSSGEVLAASLIA
jgi:hypothetical protein